MRLGGIAALCRLCVVLLSFGLLANCANVRLTQDRDEMLVQVGSTREPHHVTPHANLYLAYALLSDQTYADSLYEPKNATKPYELGDGTYCFEVERNQPCIDYTPDARRILGGYRRIYAKKEGFACPPARSNCTEPLSGLGVQIWMKRSGPVCSEAVIAFRGTDGASADDWLSNLRWVTRLLPLYDQYEQVQDYTPEFVERLRRERCFIPGRTRMVAIGHSLGGGLAQQAAYKHAGIHRVFAFDPSFVTGSSDLPAEEFARNAKGLVTDRIYEHGEVLAYPRFVLRHIVPPSVCSPTIRSIRFNSVSGTIIEQHKLKNLASAFLHWSRQPRTAAIERKELPGPPPECPPKWTDPSADGVTS